MRLALTPGEPAGIGPDIALQLATHEDCPAETECVLVADAKLLAARAAQLHLTPDIRGFVPDLPQPGFSLLDVPGADKTEPGTIKPATAGYVLDCLKLAVDGCLEGQFSGLVTGPVNKAAINAAGIAFSGHTEFLAALTETPRVVMLLVAKTLRVALLTTHLPLREVPDAISGESLAEVIKILDAELGRFFTSGRPRIAVTGLNPHAGESGYLGTEEIEIITPVVRALSAQGFKVSGPWPADTLFTRDNLDGFDVALAMYHDQGLPVLKHAGFGNAVNVTLGLPMIRTSVDHGTALDLAGTGKAGAGSLKAALYLAADMSRRGGGH